MDKYKALITDLDGTVMNIASDGSEINEAARSAVRQAQKQGYKIACATGRRWDYAKPVVRKLGITTACVIEGGTRIVDPATEETLWERHLDRNALGAILDIFKREAESSILSTSTISRQPLSDIQEVTDDARFMYLLDTPPNAAAAVCNAINGQGFAVAHSTPAWTGGGKMDVHVTHPEATKEHAIQVWQQKEGVRKTETIGMGDGGNDVPLFESVGLKVAVGNATPELKQLADYIAPDHNNGALAHVIEHFLLKTK